MHLLFHRLSQSPLQDFFRFWCARVHSGTSTLARAFGFIDRFISGGFALFNFFFLSCLYIVSLPKILASRLVASLIIPLKINVCWLSDVNNSITEVF